MDETYTCLICGKELTANEAYEYRGAFSCGDRLDEMREKREWQRQEIIAEESAKTAPLKGLDFSDSAIGKANQKLMRAQREIARKESGRLKDYEGRTNDQ